ncbi:hypothetical protein [Thiolinea disciformis]|uniref:hypothetical protein n=1 Tax=Thiolinea disciformis TaxID=125614 RepID=UPI0003712CFC|nr:hypothetical protein [Thiolinea disciformis]
MSDYDAWGAGWLLGKYQQYQPWPDESQLDEWIDGFKVGTTEVGEFHIWPQQLWEYSQGMNAPDYVIKYARKPK